MRATIETFIGEILFYAIRKDDEVVSRQRRKKSRGISVDRNNNLTARTEIHDQATAHENKEDKVFCSD